MNLQQLNIMIRLIAPRNLHFVFEIVLDSSLLT